MNLREAISEWKCVCISYKEGEEPRKNALSREPELATKAAQEDVVANIDLAITVVLFATGFWKIGICAALWTICQAIEALKWEIMLRTERRRMELRK